MKKQLFFSLLCVFSLFFSSSVYSNFYEGLNAFEVLGLEKSATVEQIKKAYRKEAGKWHPDKWTKSTSAEQKFAEEKFKEIKWAYEILQDHTEREKHRNPGYSAGEDFSTQTDSKEGSAFGTFKDVLNEKTSTETVELKPYEKKAIEIFHEFSFFQKTTSDFLSAETRYLAILKEQQEGEKLSKEQKKELNEYRVENLKDLEVFKRVLSQLGLPHQVLHPVLLQTYLDDLKREWHNKNQSSQPLLKDSNKSSLHSHLAQGDRFTQLAGSRFDMKELKRVLEQIKSNFDVIQYEALKENSHIFKKTFLNNFGTQFIVFHAALGFSIYMRALADKKISGYEKNPEELMEAAKQSLTPAGILSFFIFVSVASKVQYRLYGLGRFMDGKTVLGKSWNGKMARSLAPGLGLGAGFLFYSIFDGLWRDPHLAPCVKEFFKSGKEENSLKQHISPCRQFYLNWQAGEKWKIYGVDIVGIIGSSILSHKITSSIARHLSRTMIGHSAMAWSMRKLGPRVIRGGNFFINMLLFLEIHKLLESWAGKSLKEQILAGGVDEHVSSLSSRIEYLDLIQPEFWDQNPNNLAQEKKESARFWTQSQDNKSHLLFKSIIDSIQSLGNRFRIWTEFVNQDYISSYHYWTQKLNKKFINYESSLMILNQLFVLSQLDYNREPEDNFLSEYDEDIQDFIISNNSSYNFQRRVLDEDRTYYKEKYCPLLKKRFFKKELKLWINFCEEEKGNLFYSDPKQMIYESSHFIYDFLQKIKFSDDDLSDYDLKEENYISLKREEMFSSDPDFSIQNFVTETNAMDYDKRIFLARKMIQKGLEVYELETDLSMKFLTAGIYLLQDFLRKAPYLAYSMDNAVWNAHFFEPIEDLIWLIETYKKGERAFVEYTTARESAKTLFSKVADQIPGINQLMDREGNPYFIFYDLICRSAIEIDPDSFSAPQLLKEFDSIELYDFKTNQYEPLSALCRDKAPRDEKVIHEFLFEKPASYQKLLYENLYLSVEHIVGSKYQSRENLMKDYYELSLSQLELLRKTSLAEIQLLTDEFYKKTINKEIGIAYNADELDSVNEELLNYYAENKVYFNYCSLFADLSFDLSKNLIGDCEEGFKNIETSIFQVNHLLKNLKKLLVKGGEIKICDKEENCETLNQRLLGFEEELSEELFDKMHSSVISHLQSIQDCYREESEEECLGENFTQIFMSYILAYSAPSLFGQSSLMDYNLENTNSHWEKIVYSILFEIRKSLDNFHNQLMPLNLIKNFEKRLENPAGL